MKLNSPQELIDAIRQGEMVVVMDEGDPDNEGSLIMAAEQVDAEAINFMAHHARGLICLALTEERCKLFNLPLMADSARHKDRKNFTVSIEATEGVTTGISAADRAHTVQVAVAADAVSADLVQPGHIFPVMAHPGGVMGRSGHTEAACDLTRLAGCMPAGTVVGIMNKEGEMARGEELCAFAEEHNLKVGTIADLIHHRILHEGTIQRTDEYEINSKYGALRVIAYHDDYTDLLHLALVKGEIKIENPTLVRVQSVETVRDLLSWRPTAGAEQWNLERSLHKLEQEGKGVVVLLAKQELPRSVMAELKQLTPDSVAPEVPTFPQRTLGIGAQILRDLNVRKMRLMNAPVKFKAISGYDMEVAEFVPYAEESAEL